MTPNDSHPASYVSGLLGRATLPAGLTRTRVVWAALAIGLTGVVGVLSIVVGPVRGGDTSLAAAAIETTNSWSQAEWTDRLFRFAEGTEQAQFTGIVIHHSGDQAGSSATIADEHEARGIRGLGYHFVVGNGRGSGDGEIQAGFRWQRQLPGAHVIGASSRSYNETTIGICLVGDGDRRHFTSQQITTLLELVNALQERYGIDDGRVYLHRDVAPTASPGRLFPELDVRQRLLDLAD